MAEVVVKTVGLTKVYRNRVQALKGIDLSVYLGEIFCLLGPNGAGKTTTLRILSTQLEPSSGEAFILGFNVLSQASSIRDHIAVVPQEALPDPELTAWDHVFYYLLARGHSFKEAKYRARWALEILELWDQRGIAATYLSGGMRKRILVAMAIATRAPVLFLDEVSAGLDPLSRRSLWKALFELKAECTIILTTHAMDEAEALADRVAILNQGRVLKVGSPQELKKLIHEKHKLILTSPSLLDGLGNFGRVESYGGKTIVYPHDDKARHHLFEQAMEKEVEILMQPITLEDVFIKLISEAAT
ncbi:MAG: Daunorubicin/doxorubicin resistance ATP-binding protein DrrA [Syntrophomonadaceae bacterium]|nr:Daunorubicin/doxorubicin resistance ATP-binding protein DrrA [Bacillota bacterium]